MGVKRTIDVQKQGANQLDATERASSDRLDDLVVVEIGALLDDHFALCSIFSIHSLNAISQK